MVYCGKASLGCDSCRTRRIRCDKVKPNCTQCVRVGKQCPGYRDQLSLMFRDESSKVMRRAHARWGADTIDGQAGPSSSRASSTPDSAMGGASTPTALSAVSPHPGRSVSRSRDTHASPTPVAMTPQGPNGDPEDEVLRLFKTVGASPTERGVQFYVDHYVLGHPEEPKTVGELFERQWFVDPLPQHLMAAIGLGGMSNLRDDPATKDLARAEYVLSLQEVGKAIQKPQAFDPHLLMRCVVMLALFEVVKGTHVSSHSAHAHILGAAALMKSLIPIRNTPGLGLKGLMQLCYSMLIPCIITGVDLPSAFFDWTTTSSHLMPPEERASVELLTLLVDFVRLSHCVRTQAFADGAPETEGLMTRAIALDAALERWEDGAAGKWRYAACRGDFPAEACFRGRYHRYEDMWTARVWSHYRWGRVLLLQLIADLARRYPASSAAHVAADDEAHILETVARVAEDVLVSIPTHWRHPALSPAQRAELETSTGAAAGGAGAAGVPAVMFHLRAAACAPGVPPGHFRWALALMEAVWGDMGMLQVRSLMELMRAHQEAVQRGGYGGRRASRDPWEQ